jgi:hypothetical protein
MTIPEKYDKMMTGVITGFILPFLTVFIIFLFAKGNPGLFNWLKRIKEANIVTHVITLCVFPNVFIFFLFNHFDMLRASRGILGVTIFWAVIVFGVKFLL